MSAAQMSFRPRGLYIGGEWCASRAGRTMRTINPATGEVLGEVPWAGEEDVAAAVVAAQRGAAEWRRVPPAERARSLERLAARITDHVDELALMDAVDSGNAISGMRTDMELAAATLRYFAGLVREIKGETIVNGPHHLNYTLRQPYGVVGKINAFNHPFRFCAEKAAAPLAAGNSVVIKQPEQAPLSGLRFRGAMRRSLSTGRGQRADRGCCRRLGARAASRRAPRCVHRLGGDGADRGPRGGRNDQARLPGAGWQESDHHLPGRRPGRGGEAWRSGA